VVEESRPGEDGGSAPMLSDITVGLELEWADVDRQATIPQELGWWNDKDYSVVNSDGHANSPDGTGWRWGGEVNTRPTASLEEVFGIVTRLAARLNPTINYKCNLHVHCRDSIRFDELVLDVEKLKRFYHYLGDNAPFVYTHVEHLVPPDPDHFQDFAAYNGAARRYRRNIDSHQHQLPPKRVAELLVATTPDEFKNAHASPMANGNRAWHIAKRPGMNMRSLWKHGTVEYRHFPGTADPEEAVMAAKWCQLLTEEATCYAFGMETRSASQLYELHSPWKFPQFRPYDHQLQLGFEKTRHEP